MAKFSIRFEVRLRIICEAAPALELIRARGSVRLWKVLPCIAMPNGGQHAMRARYQVTTENNLPSVVLQTRAEADAYFQKCFAPI